MSDVKRGAVEQVAEQNLARFLEPAGGAGESPLIFLTILPIVREDVSL